MASEQARRQLYEAVATHRADLEIERSFSKLELEFLDRQIEETQRLLEWLEQTSSADLFAAKAPQQAVFAVAQ